MASIVCISGDGRAADATVCKTVLGRFDSYSPDMNDVTLIEKPIKLAKIKEISAQQFGDMVKAVVDIEKGIMVIGAGMHADEEAFLLDKGSKQENLWGINIYHELSLTDRIEFDSMINIRPKQHNTSREVQDEAVREKIIAIVNKLIAD